MNTNAPEWFETLTVELKPNVCDLKLTNQLWKAFSEDTDTTAYSVPMLKSLAKTFIKSTVDDAWLQSHTHPHEHPTATEYRHSNHQFPTTREPRTPTNHLNRALPIRELATPRNKATKHSPSTLWNAKASNFLKATSPKGVIESSSIVSRCPHCNSAQQISIEQLKSGTIQCTSCPTKYTV